jgi:hypothetical protein
MPILREERVIMSPKCHFLLLLFVVSAGCTILDRRPPNLESAPPYWQPESQRVVQNQLEEMRVFHDKESAKMSEDIHVFRNREMERLAKAGKELEKDKLWQEDYEKTIERREKWASWFKKKNKEESKNDTSVASGDDQPAR